MVPGNKFGIFHGTSNKVLGQGEQVLPHCGCRSVSTWIYLDPKENIGKHISVKGSISMYKLYKYN